MFRTEAKLFFRAYSLAHSTHPHLGCFRCGRYRTLGVCHKLRIADSERAVRDDEALLVGIYY